MCLRLAGQPPSGPWTLCGRRRRRGWSGGSLRSQGPASVAGASDGAGHSGDSGLKAQDGTTWRSARPQEVSEANKVATSQALSHRHRGPPDRSDEGWADSARPLGRRLPVGWPAVSRVTARGRCLETGRRRARLFLQAGQRAAAPGCGMRPRPGAWPPQTARL